MIMIQNVRARVLIVGPQRFVIDSIAARLEGHSGISVAGTATSLETAVAVLECGGCELALIDAQLPNGMAYCLAGHLKTLQPSLNVVLLSSVLNDGLLLQTLAGGLQGLILSSDSASEVCEQLVRVMNGEQVFSRSAAERLEVDPLTGRHRLVKSPLGELTDRQIEVLRHLAIGQSVKEIARDMHLSLKSVDSHKYRIMNKLHIHDRVELCRFAIREGLTDA